LIFRRWQQNSTGNSGAHLTVSLGRRLPKIFSRVAPAQRS
jgi:hypothetical protein